MQNPTARAEPSRLCTTAVPLFAVAKTSKKHHRKKKKAKKEGVPVEPIELSPEELEARAAAAREKVLRLKDKRKAMTAEQYAASRDLAAKIAHCPAPEQAAWLSQSGKAGLQANETDITADMLCPLPSKMGLETGLKSLERNWAQEFCSTSGRQPGEPSVLFVSPAAMGAIDMMRACPELNSRCPIAKLFAKHMKVEEQASILRSKPICMGAGTPSRLTKLVDDGVLLTGRLKWIVVDVRLDPKQRCIMDMPDVRDDWWALWEKHLGARVESGARVVLYGGEP